VLLYITQFLVKLRNSHAMRQTIVNLALPVVHETIKEVLATHPIDHPQQGVDPAEMRERLTAFVVTRLPARYIAVDEATAESMRVPMHCYSVDQHHHIKQLVHQGIQRVLSNPEGATSPPASSPHFGIEPSNWFG
jgi:hypothetical protein